MTFQPTRQFVKDVKKLGKKYASLGNDLAQLRYDLTDNPKFGESLGRGCYKIRMAITSKGQGKSGGARVITCVKIENHIIYFLRYMISLNRKILLIANWQSL